MKKFALIFFAFIMLIFPSCNSVSDYNYKNITEAEYSESGFSAENQVIKFYSGTLRNGYFENESSPVKYNEYAEEIDKENDRESVRFIYNISDSNNIESYCISWVKNLKENYDDTDELNWLTLRIAERIDYYREPEKILEKAGIKANVKDVILFAQPSGPIAKEIGIFFECGKTDYVYIMEEHWDVIDGKSTNYTYPEYVIPHDIYLETIRIFKPWTLYGGVSIEDWQRYNDNFKVEDYKISLVED